MHALLALDGVARARHCELVHDVDQALRFLHAARVSDGTSATHTLVQCQHHVAAHKVQLDAPEDEACPAVGWSVGWMLGMAHAPVDEVGCVVLVARESVWQNVECHAALPGRTHQPVVLRP